MIDYFSRIVRLFLALVCSLTTAAASPLFDIVPIPAPAGSGAYGSAGFDINIHGDVVGAYSAFTQDGIARLGGFLFTDAGGTLDLSVAGTRSTSAEGINDAGQIALSTGDWDGRWRVTYRYTPGVGLQQLGNLGGEESEAFAINGHGQITGFSHASDEDPRVFRYTDGAGIENISGTAVGRGLGINDRGWIAGIGNDHAILYRDEGNIDFGPGRAYGLNNRGDVVGMTGLVPGHPTAFVYRDGQMTILADDVFGSPVLGDINENGQAVGWGYVGQSQQALFWSEATGLVELNDLLPENSGWLLASASAINDRGQITGQGLFNGQFMAYRLDPIPEPSTWALMVLGGAAGLFCLRRRKR